MIILRNEAYGGTVFDNSSATLIRLDKEAFSAVLKYVCDVELSFCEQRMIQQVDRHVPLSGPKCLRFAQVHQREDNLFVTNGPELVDFQITYRCNSYCPHCYVDASAHGPTASLRHVLRALDEFAKGRVLQIAFGGGEPTLHPALATILKETFDRGIVPNLTTNGKELPTKVIDAIIDYCGAIAFSVEEIGEAFSHRRGYDINRLFKLASSLMSVGVNVVFHVTVARSNLRSLPEIVGELSSLNPYGIVFLVHKPVGRGRLEESLASVDPQILHEKLKAAVKHLCGKTNVGFDGCFAPGLSLLSLQSKYETYEGCSAARTSANVTPTLNVRPCSFIKQIGGNLNSQTLPEIWNGDTFESFRYRMVQHISKCANCTLVNHCLAGCPAMSLIPCTLHAYANTN